MTLAPAHVRVDRDEVFLEHTKSICPVCRAGIDAEVNVRDNKVFLRKRCRDHGDFEALLYGDAEMYVDMRRPGGAPTLAEDVVRMDDAVGTRSSLALSILVGIGANRGLPMSTTHVATGAIAGASGAQLDRLNRGTLNGFAMAWLATLPAAALAAGLVHLALG